MHTNLYLPFGVGTKNWYNIFIMINQQLLDFIKKQIEQGVNRETITKELLGNGWNSEDIEEAFKVSENPISSTSFYNNNLPPIQIKKHSKIKIFLIILIFILLIGGSFAYCFRSSLVNLPIIVKLFMNKEVVEIQKTQNEIETPDKEINNELTGVKDLTINYYNKINFVDIIKEDFLNPLNFGKNIYLDGHDKPTENKSYLLGGTRVASNWKEYIFFFWANGSKEDRTADGSDFIKIEIADISDMTVASKKFSEVYKTYIEQTPEQYTTKPTIVEKYTDLISQKAFYDYHYEQDIAQFKNKYAVAYIFTINNIYVLVEGKFANSNNKDLKNEIIANVGEKIKNTVKGLQI